MDAKQAPPPPPPPPHGGGDAGSRSHATELPPHLQAMMREVQATFGAQQPRNDQQLPLQFGRSSGRANEHRQDKSNMYGGGSQGRGGRGGYRGGRGSRGGRGNQRGRGRGGRGRFGEHHDQNHYGPLKRKRDFDGAARFFLPSFLEDPWLPLLRINQATMTATELPAPSQHNSLEVIGLVHGKAQQREGRVLFKPTFLDDPWATLLSLQENSTFAQVSQAPESQLDGIAIVNA